MQIAARRNPVARAFTLIELIAVIVVLAILSGIAIPKYFDYTTKAKESAVKGTLGAVRSAVANFYANESLKPTGAAFPTLVQLETLGTVLQEHIPSNPFVAGANSGKIQAADWDSAQPTVFPVTNTGFGWNYDATDGKFWPNSNVNGENGW
jgi:prepilin-type N-terminal cleavage/methylation domain-containing protein